MRGGCRQHSRAERAMAATDAACRPNAGLIRSSLACLTASRPLVRCVCTSGTCRLLFRAHRAEVTLLTRSALRLAPKIERTRVRAFWARQWRIRSDDAVRTSLARQTASCVAFRLALACRAGRASRRGMAVGVRPRSAWSWRPAATRAVEARLAIEALWLAVSVAHVCIRPRRASRGKPQAGTRGAEVTGVA
jgi:hypothetical protein